MLRRGTVVSVPLYIGERSTHNPLYPLKKYSSVG